MTRRCEHASTVLTSNKGFEAWGGIFGDDVMSTALIDRLVHHCHLVTIRGNSYRMRLEAARGPVEFLVVDRIEHPRPTNISPLGKRGSYLGPRAMKEGFAGHLRTGNDVIPRNGILNLVGIAGH